MNNLIFSLVKEKFEAMLKMRSKWQEEEDRAKEESIEEPGDIVQVDSNQVTGSASCGQNSGNSSYNLSHKATIVQVN